MCFILLRSKSSCEKQEIQIISHIFCPHIVCSPSEQRRRQQTSALSRAQQQHIKTQREMCKISLAVQIGKGYLKIIRKETSKKQKPPESSTFLSEEQVMTSNTEKPNTQNLPQLVAVHPLVLLSVVDHFNRVAKMAKNKRVVGVLLGQKSQGKADITNCYAIPFDEDPKQPNIWFVDHIYHETMASMFKKVNAREKVLGWYTTGQNFKRHDIQINEVFKKYTPNPILLIVDVENQDKLALPTEAYSAVEEVSNNGEIVSQFVHLQSSVEAFEPEEIGVEHLLREIRDVSVNTLTTQVSDKIQALKGMMGKVLQIKEYIEAVLTGKVQANNEILYNIQEILNLLPNLNNTDMIKSFAAKNNDMMFVLYVCSLSKSIIALHSLINNKLANREAEQLNKTKGEETKKDAAAPEVGSAGTSAAAEKK